MASGRVHTAARSGDGRTICHIGSRGGEQEKDMGVVERRPARDMTPGYPQHRRRTFPGQPDQMKQVRLFLDRVLDGCPAAPIVIQLANELTTNAVVHSESKEEGGRFRIRVHIRKGEWVRIAVWDQGGPWGGHAREDHTPDEHGNGLFLVEAVAREWGMVSNASGRTVWFRCAWS